ncbi:MAG: TolC family protein [Salinivirgaceae bacterium]|jgi:outer membrane protein|nr:TolC family protein [Salinivirgaceae bacterium]
MMNRLKQIALMLILGLFGGQVFAQNDTIYKFTLQQAQEFAIDNFFVSKNAKLDIKSAQKKIWETTAIGLPQISGGIDYTYMPEIPEVNFPQTIMGANKGDNEPIYGGDFRNPDFYSMVPGEPITMGVTNNVSYNIMLTQLIFSGEYIIGLQATRAYKAFAQENYNKVKIDIREGIAGSYYAILILNENKIVLKETLENLKLNYEHTVKYYEQGLVEDTDVDQLNLTVKRTENTLRTIENQIQYLSNLFKYQIGIEANVEVELVEKLEDMLETNIIEPVSYQFNLEENIDYKMLSTQEDLQSLSLNREKSMFLPTLSGFYQYKDQFETPDFNTNIRHIVGISLSVPIISSGMRIAKVGQAKIELDKAQNMKDQEAERIKITANQALSDYGTALQNYYNERENFELSEKVLNKATIRFREGVVSSLELSIFNNQYLQSQLTYATAIQELLTAKIALDKAYNKL